MRHYYALFSGGLDSALAVLTVAKQDKDSLITPLFFDYGQKAADKEWQAAQNIVPILKNLSGNENIKDCQKFQIGGTGLFNWSESVVLKKGKSIDDPVADPDLENRNMILISIATSIMMSEHKKQKSTSEYVILTGFRNEHYDTNKCFCDNFNTLLDKMLSDSPYEHKARISILAPLIKNHGCDAVSPRALAKTIDELGAEELLAPGNSWSCYSPLKGNACKICTPCKTKTEINKELHKLRIHKK